MLADNRFPPASSNTNEVGLSNSFSGNANTNHRSMTAAMVIVIFLFFEMDLIFSVIFFTAFNYRFLVDLVDCF
jgi:hypothetical protein